MAPYAVTQPSYFRGNSRTLPFGQGCRLADTVDGMLRGALDVFQTDDRKRVQ